MSKSTIDHLGGVIKIARIKMQLTRKELADKLSISLRHLTSIENENHKPSYDLLFHIIRELSIPADMIFYPELGYERSEMKSLQLLLAQCDEKEMKVLAATLQSLLDNKPQ